MVTCLFDSCPLTTLLLAEHSASTAAQFQAALGLAKQGGRLGHAERERLRIKLLTVPEPAPHTAHITLASNSLSKVSPNSVSGSMLRHTARGSWPRWCRSCCGQWQCW